MQQRYLRHNNYAARRYPVWYTPCDASCLHTYYFTVAGARFIPRRKFHFPSPEIPAFVYILKYLSTCKYVVANILLSNILGRSMEFLVAYGQENLLLCPPL